jgi:signal transduction histidine kinase
MARPAAVAHDLPLAGHLLERSWIRSLFAFLAVRRPLAVGLALAVEVAALLALAQASAAAIVGVPAAVAAAIAGSVAVVFGPRTGAFVAVVGAVVFGFATGWGAGELVALVVWPGIVAAVGVFAGGVFAARAAFGALVDAQERERQRLALELHDETAQTLVAALIALKQAERAEGGPAPGPEASRRLIEEAIGTMRALAVDLRPRVLDDFGLVPALERLAESISERTGTRVALAAGAWSGRVPSEVELALYRLVQETVAEAVAAGARSVAVVLERSRARAAVTIEADGAAAGLSPGLEGMRERLRRFDGRLSVTARKESGGRTVRAELPVAAERRPRP